MWDKTKLTLWKQNNGIAFKDTLRFFFIFFIAWQYLAPEGLPAHTQSRHVSSLLVKHSHLW